MVEFLQYKLVCAKKKIQEDNEKDKIINISTQNEMTFLVSKLVAPYHVTEERKQEKSITNTYRPIINFCT